jgi:Ca2+-binding EF-hand superfamily protein
MNNNKENGVTVQQLKAHFLQVMGVNPSKSEEERILIETLMEKLDHRNSDKITWAEFLKFLDHEGMKREMVNDAQLYGIGVKRMKEKQRINLK